MDLGHPPQSVFDSCLHGILMQVHEVAEQAGVSARSVRHYDRAGLLKSRRLSNGYRQFDQSAVDQVRIVKRLLMAGLTVQDIATLHPCLTAQGEFDGCEASRRLLRLHVERLQQSIKRDRHTLALLRERQRMMAPSSP